MGDHMEFICSKLWYPKTLIKYIIEFYKGGIIEFQRLLMIF